MVDTGSLLFHLEPTFAKPNYRDSIPKKEEIFV
jgi:hypothetical protein